MNRANIDLLEAAVDHLGELVEELVFVGGVTVELWISDQGAPEFRPTDDVDAVVEAATRSVYASFERRLVAAGFRNDQESGVICRFRHLESGLVLDVMPTEGAVLGFANRWHAPAFAHAVPVSLPSGKQIRTISPSYLLATKLEAFSNRGRGDVYGSRDFGDIVVLVDGRPELVEEVSRAPDDLRSYLADEIEALMRMPSLGAGISGALLPAAEAQRRGDLVVVPRLEEIVHCRP